MYSLLLPTSIGYHIDSLLLDQDSNKKEVFL